MNNEEKILEMLASMQADIRDVKSRLNSVEDKLDDLTESSDEVRTSVNSLIAWSERVSSIEELRIPKVM